MKKILFLFILISSFSFGQSYENKIVSAKKATSEFLEKHNIPGMAISVSHRGDLIWSQGFGYANLETKQKVTPNTTQFRIASISKSITALALAKLVDDKRLDFDHSIYKYVPDFPKKKYDFTIRQVAGHIAGIRHYLGSEFILNNKMSIVEGLDVFKDSPLKFKPGSKYSYSTYGWNLLSVVVQNASQVEFNTYMKTNIFDPLKMHSTTVGLSDKEMPNRTQFYIKTNFGKVILGPAVSNEHKVAGGGFISTSEDLVKFGNELIHPNISTVSSIKELVTSQKTSAGFYTGYGLGFSVGATKSGTPKYGHSGGGIGASTFIQIYPKEDIVIVILTNLSKVPVSSFIKTLETIFID